ncbi:acyl-homoserine lactone acylase PvdQ [Striga asiatica]|uniref:Acyl-homoserine lactone acylase PvdQ n=1 Tax=Striga asiatica TaxID=4170 RepID=A0A5A7R2J8_STRAF|nr:acyl-homoserine lactone acylase PvdQ [Striga asiatica]
MATPREEHVNKVVAKGRKSEFPFSEYLGFYSLASLINKARPTWLRFVCWVDTNFLNQGGEQSETRPIFMHILKMALLHWEDTARTPPGGSSGESWTMGERRKLLWRVEGNHIPLFFPPTFLCSRSILVRERNSPNEQGGHPSHQSLSMKSPSGHNPSLPPTTRGEQSESREGNRRMALPIRSSEWSGVFSWNPIDISAHPSSSTFAERLYLGLQRLSISPFSISISFLGLHYGPMSDKRRLFLSAELVRFLIHITSSHALPYNKKRKSEKSLVSKSGQLHRASKSNFGNPNPAPIPIAFMQDQDPIGQKSSCCILQLYEMQKTVKETNFSKRSEVTGEESWNVRRAKPELVVVCYKEVDRSNFRSENICAGKIKLLDSRDLRAENLILYGETFFSKIYLKVDNRQGNILYFLFVGEQASQLVMRKTNPTARRELDNGSTLTPELGERIFENLSEVGRLSFFLSEQLGRTTDPEIGLAYPARTKEFVDLFRYSSSSGRTNLVNQAYLVKRGVEEEAFRQEIGLFLLLSILWFCFFVGDPTPSVPAEIAYGMGSSPIAPFHNKFIEAEPTLLPFSQSPKAIAQLLKIGPLPRKDLSKQSSFFDGEKLLGSQTADYHFITLGASPVTESVEFNNDTYTQTKICPCNCFTNPTALADSVAVFEVSENFPGIVVVRGFTQGLLPVLTLEANGAASANEGKQGSKVRLKERSEAKLGNALILGAADICPWLAESPLLKKFRRKCIPVGMQQSASAAAATPLAGSKTIEMFDDHMGPQCLWHSLCRSKDMPPQPPLRCLPRLTAQVFLGPPRSLTPDRHTSALIGHGRKRGGLKTMDCLHLPSSATGERLKSKVKEWSGQPTKSLITSLKSFSILR